MPWTPCGIIVEPAGFAPDVTVRRVGDTGQLVDAYTTENGDTLYSWPLVVSDPTVLWLATSGTYYVSMMWEGAELYGRTVKVDLYGRGFAQAEGDPGGTGPAGAAGTDGTALRSGSGAPAPSDGVNGDFWLQTTGTVLWGPKADGAWPGSGVSLIGATGATGPTGDAGAGLTFLASVANAAALPTESNTLDDGRQTVDDGHMHRWDGAAWIDLGQWRGDDGAAGATGAAGLGLPIAGTTGQMLAKASATDYDTEWVDAIDTDALLEKAVPVGADKVLVLDSADTDEPVYVTVAALNLVAVPPITIDGVLEVAQYTARLYNPLGVALTISTVKISVGTAPTDASLIVDVNLSGTTIFTTQGNRPTITTGTNTDLASVPDVSAWPADGYLTVDVDQVGSTVAGAVLVVQVLAARA